LTLIELLLSVRTGEPGVLFLPTSWNVADRMRVEMQNQRDRRQVPAWTSLKDASA
jgi:hypothetical protein